MFLPIFYIFLQVLRLIGRKKYIKTIKIDMKIDAVDPQAAADNLLSIRHVKESIKNYIKIDAVDPQAAADNHPPPPGHKG